MINLYYANAYCSEDISNIENYDKAIADKEQTWVCHHRLEIHEDYRNSVEELQMLNLYWQSLCEGWKHREHGPNLGRKFTDEHKNKLSMAFKGKHWKVINSKRVWIKEDI